MIELSVSEYSKLIDEWIFSERDRQIMKRRLLDAVTYEQLAEEFDMSVRNVKYIVNKNRKILLKHL
jgi:DNA-directed RNA polymerase specialized sigma24 family protein